MADVNVYLGHGRLDTPTPGSLTAVGQRRENTVAMWAVATSRGATITPIQTGCTAELIAVVRIPTQH